MTSDIAKKPKKDVPMKTFKFTNYENIQLEPKHKVIVMRMLKNRKILVFGTRYGELALWFKHKTYKPMKKWQGHKSLVTQIIELDNGRLATYGVDRKIKIWSPLLKLLQTLQTSDNGVICILGLSNNKLVTGDSLGVMVFWNIQSGK